METEVWTQFTTFYHPLLSGPFPSVINGAVTLIFQMAPQHGRLPGESSLTGLQMPAFSVGARVAKRGGEGKRRGEMQRENLSSGLLLFL